MRLKRTENSLNPVPINAYCILRWSSSHCKLSFNRFHTHNQYALCNTMGIFLTIVIDHFRCLLLPGGQCAALYSSKNEVTSCTLCRDKMSFGVLFEIKPLQVGQPSSGAPSLVRQSAARFDADFKPTKQFRLAHFLSFPHESPRANQHLASFLPYIHNHACMFPSQSAPPWMHPAMAGLDQAVSSRPARAPSPITATHPAGLAP